MPSGILHTYGVEKIFEDPFGFRVLFLNENHVNPNRFFSHWMFSVYFRNIPFLFQYFGLNPIESVYLSVAICRLSIQSLIAFLLGYYISGTRQFFSIKFLIAVLLIMPLFQPYGYYQTIGIIDQSITYNFFYSLPLGLLLIYFFPLYRALVFDQQFSSKNWLKYLFYGILALILPFSGPIIPGLVLIVALLLFSFYAIGNFKLYSGKMMKERLQLAFKSSCKIPKVYGWFLIPISILSIYSLFLGRFNTLNVGNELPISTLYNKLYHGLIFIITENIAVVLLLSAILFNLIVLWRLNLGKSLKIKFIYFCISFSALYLLLLPLGGYRIYRVFILRYDTFMPITVLLFIAFGSSCFKLFNQLMGIATSFYVVCVTVFLFIFFHRNGYYSSDRNQCEKDALYQLAIAKKGIVQIHSSCWIMGWGIVTDYHDSENNAALFHFWGITKRKVYYYQVPPRQ